MKKLMAFAAPLILLGSFIYMAFVHPHIPLLDANRTVLAETYLEGYCAGDTFVNTRGWGDPDMAAECRKGWDFDDTINHEIVQAAFCTGLVNAGYPLSTADCIDIMKDNQLWPTRGGEVTGEWNNRFPYPLENTTIDGKVDDSRTGDRDGTGRSGISRP